MSNINKEEQRISRRDFIKASSAVGVGLALGSRGVLAEQAEEELELSGPLRLRTLGRTKL